MIALSELPRSPYHRQTQQCPDGRLAAKFKPGSRHRVVRVVDVLALEASRRSGADRIGSTIDTLVDAGAEY